MKFETIWDNFIQQLHDKMVKGYKEYGDESFNRAPQDLIKELQAETLDLAGWGLILWARLEAMKDKLNGKEN